MGLGFEPFQAEQRLAEVPEGFADEEVNAVLGLDLLVEHVSDERLGRRAVRLPLPGGAQIAGDQGGVAGYFLSDLGGGPVDLERAVGLADGAELLPAAVEGHDLEDLGPRIEHLFVHGADGIGVLDGKLRGKCPGDHVAPLLQRHDIAAVAEYDAFLKLCQDRLWHGNPPSTSDFRRWDEVLPVNQVRSVSRPGSEYTRSPCALEHGGMDTAGGHGIADEV